MTESGMATARWQALGTRVVVRVTRQRHLKQATRILREELLRIDRAASNFRPDSELSLLLKMPGSAVVVSDALAQAVRVALTAASITDGLVDPTLGASPGWREVEATAWTVCVPPGATLDLGATGKALAADRAAAAIGSAIEGDGVMVSLGGDIATAGQAPLGGWLIYVTDDHRSSTAAPGQMVTIDAGALATSGTTVRRDHNGHHIIDPRTRAPAVTPWRTVSVTAATCVDANTASTAAVVLGTAAPDWLAEQGLAARLVDNRGFVTTVGGWPPQSEAQP
jgi:thiamine biosynthesis lipoprotein